MKGTDFNVTTFSILIPVHNEAEFLDESIQSILDQSELDWELIIVDDGSTDDTCQRAESYDDDRIRVLSPGKIGKNAAFNRAFEHSTGDWIALFAGDDRMCVDSLRDRRAPFLGRDPIAERLAILSKLRTFSDDPRFDGMVIPRGKESGNTSGGAILMSRGLAAECFPLPTSLPNEDLWTGLCLRHFATDVKVAPVVTYHYRIHDGNSVKRTDSFHSTSQKLRQRHAVYELFLNAHQGSITESARRELVAHSRAEQLRLARAPARIMFLRALPLATRLSFAMNSHPVLHRLRMRLWSLLSGWRGG